MHEPPTRPSLTDRVLDRIALIGMTMSGIALVILIAIFGWLVFGRYVLNSTPTWAEQLGLLLIVGLSFVAAAIGIHENRHLSVEFIRDALPLRIRIWLYVLSDALMLAFGGVMASLGYKLAAINAGRGITLLGVSGAMSNLPMPVCGVLIVLFSGARLYRHFQLALGRRVADSYITLEQED